MLDFWLTLTHRLDRLPMRYDDQEHLRHSGSDATRPRVIALTPCRRVGSTAAELDPEAGTAHGAPRRIVQAPAAGMEASALDVSVTGHAARRARAIPQPCQWRDGDRCQRLPEH